MRRESASRLGGMVLAASIGAIACTDGAKSSRGGADAAVTNGPGPE